MNKVVILCLFAFLYVASAQFGVENLAADLQQNLMVEYINSV